MVLGAGGTPVRVRVEPATFDLDVDGIEAALTSRTRVVLINTPNNPTGRIYPPATLARLADALRRHGGSRDRPVYLLSDESYSKVLFDGHRMVTGQCGAARAPQVRRLRATIPRSASSGARSRR
jgi:aspartate aminotransferase